MSLSYADGLSEYEYKGVLGVPEKFESDDKVNEKCEILANWIKNAKHVVVHTGAGISTSAGIPDFRGPNGVWTLEKQGKKPNINISFNEAIPSKTHMALKHLIDNKVIHYIISQNIDGLHLRTGVSRNNISELHGNMFIGQCNICESQFVRSEATSTVGKKCLNEDCKRSAMLRGRSCRGKLHDTILDWEDSLPEFDLEMSDYQSSLADLNICLGTTLQIVPSGNLPLRCKKYGGKVVIVNLQPTKHDKKADLIINTYVDEVLGKVMKKLGLEIPEYTSHIDPTKHHLPETAIEWNILKRDLNQTKVKYDKLVKEHKKRKLEENELNNTKKKPKTDKTKVEVVVKLEKLNKKQKKRIIRNDLRINIENQDYNNAKSRVKNENLTKIESRDKISVKTESFNNSENTEINSSSRENGDYPEPKVEDEDPNHLDNGVEKLKENISESKDEGGTNGSTLENKDFEERTDSGDFDSPKIEDTERNLKNENISENKDEGDTTDFTLKNKDFEERTESGDPDSPKIEDTENSFEPDVANSQNKDLQTHLENSFPKESISSFEGGMENGNIVSLESNDDGNLH